MPLPQATPLLRFFCCWFVILGLSAVSAAELTEESVREFLDNYYAALDAKSVDEMAKFFSNSATLTLSARGRGGQIGFQFSKQDYFERLKLGFANLDGEYKHEVLRTTVEIDGNRANVFEVAQQHFQRKGRSRKVRSQTDIVVALERGKLKIVKVEGELLPFMK